MNADERPSLEDRLVDLLAAYDDALAEGGAAPSEVAPSAETPPQLQRDLAYLQILRQVLKPGRAKTSAETPRSSATPPHGAMTTTFGSAAGTTEQPEDLTLTSLGRFQIRRELGRGGFGVVFLAYDPSLQRDVALKVPRAEGLITPEFRARFQREARASASLDHPHIVSVHEVGEVGPLCYIVSAYCPGTSLSEWLNRQAAPVPVQDAAALIQCLAEAVHHAHSRGVVHRDLKPGNVLLATGHHSPLTTHHSSLTTLQPKITDFGLAKLLKDEQGSAETRSGAVMGTPQYMAPEQAAGKNRAVGPAADVYALGVILYELLTGRTPFQGETPLDTLLQVQAAEPLPPTRLRPRLPRDLETICLKCLEKPPARRYASAQDLAEDLRRFQAGEPIKARPIGRVEHAARWIRKKPATAALLALVTLLGVAALGGLLWYQQLRLDWKAEEARQAAEEARQEVLKNVRQQGLEGDTAAALDEMENLTAKLKHKLADPLRVHELQSDIDGWKTTLESARASWERANKLAARDVLEPGLAARLKSDGEHLRDIEVDWRLAKELDEIRLEASTPYDGNFDKTKAGPKYAKLFNGLGLDLANGKPAQLADWIMRQRLRYVLVAALDHWASVALLTNDEALLGQLSATARRADPDPWRDQVRDIKNRKNRQLLEKLAREIDVARHSPHMVIQLNTLLSAQHEETPKVLPRLFFHPESPRLLRRALVVYPKDFWLNFTLATSVKDLAEEIGCLRAALAARPINSIIFYNLGHNLTDQKDFAGAIVHYQKALEIAPDNAWTHNSLGYVLAELAEKKDFKTAMVHYQKALDRDSMDPLTHVNLGNAIYKSKGSLEDAIRHFQTAIDLDRQLAEKGYPGLVLRDKSHVHNAAKAHTNLGMVLKDKKDLEGMLRHCLKAVEIAPHFAVAQSNLGAAYLETGNLDKAIHHSKEAVKLDAEEFQAHFNLGLAHHKKGNRDDAGRYFKQVIALDPTHVESHYNLGVILHDQGDGEGAFGYLQKALALDPELGRAHNNLGRILAEKGKLDEALSHFQKAVKFDATLAVAHANLGKALGLKKDVEGARRALLKAIELDGDNAGAHCQLGGLYRDRGDFAKALEYMKRGHALGSQQPGWTSPSEKWVKQSEQLLALDQKLSAVVAGKVPAGNSREQLALADLCRLYKQQYATAARFYGSAFAAEPRLTEPVGPWRYRAASCAVRAASGQGKDAAELDDRARAKLRREAHAWLKADLLLFDNLVNKAELPRDAIRLIGAALTLTQWQSDPDLASVSAEKMLAKLPPEEQELWRKLWSESADLGKNARASFTASTHQGTLTGTKREAAHERDLKAGQTLVIDLESKQFDTLLRLEDSKGNLLAENDDITPTSLNSRLVFTAPAEGPYRIVATSYEQRGQGTYTLTIRTFMPTSR